MHQHSFSQGLSSFFQCLAHRLGADAVHYLPLHQLISQQMQRPASPALRRLGAGQGYQVRFSLTVQLLRAAVDLLLASQGPLQTLLDTAAAHPFHRGVAHLQHPGYFLVLHCPALLGFIAEQQDAGVGLLICCRPSPGHQPLQFLLLLRTQPDPVLLGWHLHPPNFTSPLLYTGKITAYYLSFQSCWTTRTGLAEVTAGGDEGPDSRWE